MSDSPLISFEDAGKLLCLHHTTLRQRKAGTELLTHVEGLGRRKMLVRREVVELARRVIKQSIEADQERKSLLRMAS